MTNKDPDKKIEAVDKSREKFAGAYAVLAGKDPDKMSERELRVEVKALRAEIKKVRGRVTILSDMLTVKCDELKELTYWVVE